MNKELEGFTAEVTETGIYDKNGVCISSLALNALRNSIFDTPVCLVERREATIGYVRKVDVFTRTIVITVETIMSPAGKIFRKKLENGETLYAGIDAEASIATQNGNGTVVVNDLTVHSILVAPTHALEGIQPIQPKYRLNFRQVGN